MIVSICVKPNAKKEFVKRKPDGSFIVSVKSPATEGKANDRVVKVLAKYFGIAPSCVSIRSGASSRMKRVEVLV